MPWWPFLCHISFHFHWWLEEILPDERWNIFSSRLHYLLPCSDISERIRITAEGSFSLPCFSFTAFLPSKVIFFFMPFSEVRYYYIDAAWERRYYWCLWWKCPAASAMFVIWWYTHIYHFAFIQNDRLSPMPYYFLSSSFIWHWCFFAFLFLFLFFSFSFFIFINIWCPHFIFTLRAFSCFLHQIFNISYFQLFFNALFEDIETLYIVAISSLLLLIYINIHIFLSIFTTIDTLYFLRLLLFSSPFIFLGDSSAWL